MLQTNHKGKVKEGRVYYAETMYRTDTHTH